MAQRRYIAIFTDSPQALYPQAQSWTPHIELFQPPQDGTPALVLEVMARQEQEVLRELDLLPEVRSAAASTRAAALLAARTGTARSVKAGKESALLAPLPVEALGLLAPEMGRDVGQTLFRWGVRTPGDLSALPEDELAARLGQAGTRLQKIARGEDIRPLPLYEPRAGFEEYRELEWTLDSLEPLSFLASGMLEELCQRLGSQGLAAESLHIRLGLEGGGCLERTIQLAFPLHSSKVLLSLLRLDLQSRPLQSGIRSVSLSVQPTRARTLQYSLLQASQPDPAKLSRTLARLTALVGERRLGRPAPLDTHRPDAVRLEPLRLTAQKKQRSFGNSASLPARSADISPAIRLTLRRLRPPRPIQLNRQDVRASAGPWRSSGDWWQGTPQKSGWNRDEWDLELENGLLCRVFWDEQCKDWFLEGIYD